MYGLKTIDRPEVIKLIELARAFGDLTENAEYDTAKDRQGFIEARIKELESKLSRAEVIDPSKLSSKDRVMFGVRVTLEEIETDDPVTYQLVGPDESEPENGFISVTSPLGRALLGKREGDEVRVQTPGGLREFCRNALNIKWNPKGFLYIFTLLCFLIPFPIEGSNIVGTDLSVLFLARTSSCLQCLWFGVRYMIHKPLTTKLLSSF